MLPTLAPGDRLLVARPTRLRPGQIVALRDPHHPRRLLVKRVSSVLGDTVTVHGDNLAASTDSRVFGPVERGQVLGAVLRRYGPVGRAGPVP
jgi:nickel-type superoxide dismutase maturation protease